MSAQHQPLSQKVAIVTGSSRGIGAAIALKLASHGADVVINYLSSATAAAKVVEQARALGVKAISIKADVSKPQDVAHLFEQAKSQLGRVDIVMSNSGIEHFGAMEDVKEEDLDKVFAVNVKAQFFIAQEASRYLVDGGRLLLTSSVAAFMAVPRHALYAASKAAITGMTKCLACDFGPRNITVNCVAPGAIKTDMYADSAIDYIPGGSSLTLEEIDEKVRGMSPMKKLGYPDDVANVVAFLASPDAQWLTGQTIHVSGGAHMATC